MRLWHKDLLPLLPRQQLLGQHREACALRGLGWGKKHATVDYVFTHPYTYLYRYHMRVMEEIAYRRYNLDMAWIDYTYRGKRVGYDTSEFTQMRGYSDYPEHNAEYLAECIANLKGKGIEVKL